VPAEKFWAVTACEFETGGTFFDDVDNVAVSSKQKDLVINSDGSVTLTFGPKLPEGMPKSNLFLPLEMAPCLFCLDGMVLFQNYFLHLKIDGRLGILRKCNNLSILNSFRVRKCFLGQINYTYF
jgi:hypothetical protein